MNFILTTSAAFIGEENKSVLFILFIEANFNENVLNSSGRNPMNSGVLVKRLYLKVHTLCDPCVLKRVKFSSKYQ